MSVSRAEAEAMDKSELADAIAELSDRLEDQEATIQRLEALTDALQKQNSQLKTMLAGSPDAFGALNVDNMVPLHDRVDDVEQTVADHEDRFEMFVVEDGGQSTPDQRAMHLRQVLLNRANKNDENIAKMRRESAEMALGGTLHKGTVLDAMRRAADGTDANIDGASDLQPLNAVTFHRGGTVGSNGEPEQSYIEMDSDDLTGTEARQILTTDGEGGGV